MTEQMNQATDQAKGRSAGLLETATIGRRELMGLGGALAITACAPGIVTRPGASRHFDWAVRPPEEAGFSQAGIAGIRATLQKLIDDGHITGVVSAVARNNKLVWYEAQGFRDPNQGVPMPRDGIFRMASSSKPLTAVAALMMVQEGKISLDDPVSRFLPSWKNQKVAVAPKGTKDPAQVKLVPVEREVTLRHLLTHTSGVTAPGLAPNSGSPASLVNKIKLDVQERLATYVPKLGQAALEFQPGTQFSYSLTEAVDVALHLVEIVSGQPADVFLRERLFEPLEMRDTYFNVPPDKQRRIVDVYGKNDGKWQVPAEQFPPHPWKYLSGGGGLFSTAHDFMNFELMLLNNGAFNGRRVLQPDMVRLMRSDQAGLLFRQWAGGLANGFDFGLLVGIAQDSANPRQQNAGTFGWGGANGTDTWADPNRDMVGVYMVQLAPPYGEGPIAFQRAINAAIIA